MNEIAIEVHNLSINYKHRKMTVNAVNALSFKVRTGEIVGFIGPNGAGKTSAIKAIVDLIPVPNGTCFISGIPSSNPRSRDKLGYMPEISYYPKYLSLEEFVGTCAAISGVPRSARRQAVQNAIKRVRMEEFSKTKLSAFSKGMLQQAGCAQALVHDPDIFILDEPMSGLDPIARMRMRALLSELHDEGKTILFSSHELSEIELIANSVILLNKGQSIFEGNIVDILQPGENLERAFLRILGEEEVH